MEYLVNSEALALNVPCSFIINGNIPARSDTERIAGRIELINPYSLIHSLIPLIGPLYSEFCRDVFTYKGQRVLEAGDILKRPTYARTLRIIANAGNADPMYKGVLGEQMVKDVNAHGGQFMMDDFKNYKVRFRDAIEQPFGKGKIITTPPPTSGPVLSLVLNILKGTQVG